MKNTEEIESKILPLLNESAYELVDIETGHERGRNVIRVFVDKEGGVSVDDCARLSGRIGQVLDSDDSISVPYILEVSSPGVDRKLKKESDYARFTGKRIKLRLFSPLNGQRNFTGYIGKCEPGSVEVELENKAGIVKLEIKNIAIAKLDPEIKL